MYYKICFILKQMLKIRIKLINLMEIKYFISYNLEKIGM